MAEEKRKEKTENERENLKEFGEVKMEDRIHLISVIGEIRGTRVPLRQHQNHEI